MLSNKRQDIISIKDALIRYSDVIMSSMASQITGVSIVCSTVRSGTDQKKTSKLGVIALCEGNPPVTGGFPTQRASNAENVSINHVTDDICVTQPKWFNMYIVCSQMTPAMRMLYGQEGVLQIWRHTVAGKTEVPAGIKVSDIFFVV